MEIKRDNYLRQLLTARRNGLVKIVTGPRRCGKSYLLTELFHHHLLLEGVDERHIIEVSLDDRMNKALRDPDEMLAYIHSQILDEQLYYIVIDEVQLMSEFVDVLNSLLHIKNAEIYVTGSNSRFLASDIATEFRGRDYQIRIHPLSFAEYYAATELDKEKAWKEYYTYGGMPQILSFQTNAEKMRYLHNLFQTAYLSDILERYRLKNGMELNTLLRIIASSIGSPCNPSRIADTFKTVERLPVSSQTLSRYLDALSDAFLISKAERYDVKGRKYIGTLSKYYFEDVGIRNAVIGFRQQEESHLMENIIYNELRIRGYQVDVGNVELRQRNEDGKTVRNRLEVDFIANQGNLRLYIQSALSIPDREKMAQESRSLNAINDSFRKVIIVRDDIQPWYNEQGILILGLMDFLLDENMIQS